MNKKPVIVNLSEQESEVLAQGILVLANDEIANANAIFEAYSTDPYTKSVAEEIKRNSLAIKLQEFAAQSGFCIITGTLILSRSVVSSVILNSTYIATQFTITDINPATLTSSMIRLEVPLDQLKANGIYMAPEKGTYGFIQLGEVYKLVDVPEETEEEQHVDEEEISKPEVTE